MMLERFPITKTLEGGDAHLPENTLLPEVRWVLVRVS